MHRFETLQDHLDAAKKCDVSMVAVAETIQLIAAACIDIAALVAQAPMREATFKAFAHVLGSGGRI